MVWRVREGVNRAMCVYATRISADKILVQSLVCGPVWIIVTLSLLPCGTKQTLFLLPLAPFTRSINRGIYRTSVTFDLALAAGDLDIWPNLVCLKQVEQSLFEAQLYNKLS